MKHKNLVVKKSRLHNCTTCERDRRPQGKLGPTMVCSRCWDLQKRMILVILLDSWLFWYRAFLRNADDPNFRRLCAVLHGNGWSNHRNKHFGTAVSTDRYPTSVRYHQSLPSFLAISGPRRCRTAIFVDAFILGMSIVKRLTGSLHHRLRGSASPVVKVTSHFNGKLQNLTPCISQTP